jgi:hypothetical protein
VSSDGWVQYADYVRRLDAVRAEEMARTAGMRAAVAEMTTEADTLEARLNGQGGMLIGLAGELRMRKPKLTPLRLEATPDKKSGQISDLKSDGKQDEKPEERLDPAPGLSQLARIIDRGDAEARLAGSRGAYPALLPRQPEWLRCLIVYGIAALAIVALQGLAFLQRGTETNPIMVLFLIPLIGFVVGYLVLSIGSRTRVTQPVAANLHTRMGFLLCFLIGPLAAVVVAATSWQSGSTPG